MLLEKQRIVSVDKASELNRLIAGGHIAQNDRFGDAGGSPSATIPSPLRGVAPPASHNRAT
jgi:hypothetical protein